MVVFKKKKIFNKAGVDGLLKFCRQLVKCFHSWWKLENITGQVIDDVQLAFVMVKNILYKYGGCLSSDTSDSNRLLGFNQEKSLRWAGVVTSYKQ